MAPGVQDVARGVEEELGLKETPISRWKRAYIEVAKIGKGLCKDEKAQTLDARHWLESIDPSHRYGHNLKMYHGVWIGKKTKQNFLYWLDVGDGKEVNLEKCPRTDLQLQCVQYLAPEEREPYEVVVENGKLVYKQSKVSVDTQNGSKWIFVLCPSRKLYVGEKKKGLFHHSSFLAGGATIAAGILMARNGILEDISSHSGHYRPTKENFMEFCSFLVDHHVNFSNIEKSSINDDIINLKFDKDGTTNVEGAAVREMCTDLSHNWTREARLPIKCDK